MHFKEPSIYFAVAIILYFAYTIAYERTFWLYVFDLISRNLKISLRCPTLVEEKLIEA